MPIVDDGYGGTGSSGMCWISPSDMAGQVGNLMSRVANLESIVAQLLGVNVGAISLSDFTQDLGVIMSGVIGPAVLIKTGSPYAMYAYAVGMTSSPVQVDGDMITITANTEPAASAGIWDSTARGRYITFKVTEDGLYAVNANVTVALNGDVNHGYLYWSMSYDIKMNAGGNATSYNDKGTFWNGDVIWKLGDAKDSFYVEDPAITSYNYFRLLAGDTIQVSVIPTVRADVSLGTYTADPWHNTTIAALNITAERVSDL